MTTGDARPTVAFALSSGNAHDAPHYRKLWNELEKPVNSQAIVMGRAYEDDATTTPS